MIERIPVSKVELRPHVFQFKTASDTEGDNRSLHGVTRWVECFAGIVPVYQYDDGAMVAVDGHQRVNLARRLEAEGHPPIMLNAEVIHQRDGFTEDHAMLIAIGANLAAGGETTRPYDVAKVLRRRDDLPELLAGLVPPRRKSVDVAQRLCKLSDDAFEAAVRADLPEAWVALIADEIDKPERQLAVVKWIDENRPLSEEEARILIRQAQEVGFSETVNETLFGSVLTADSKMKKRAEVLSRACANLRARKSELRVVTTSNRAKRLEELGNQLAKERNRAALDAVQEMVGAIRKRAILTGPVSDLLNDAVAKLDEGMSVNAAANWLIDTVMTDPRPYLRA